MASAEHRHGDELEGGLPSDSPFVRVPDRGSKQLSEASEYSFDVPLYSSSELETPFLLSSIGETAFGRVSNSISETETRPAASFEDEQLLQLGVANRGAVSDPIQLDRSATAALRRILARPEMRQAFDAALSRKPGGRWVEIRGRSFPAVTYLRALARLSREALEGNADVLASAGEGEQLDAALSDGETEDLLSELLKPVPSQTAITSSEAADEHSGQSEYESTQARDERSGPDYIRWIQIALNAADHAGLAMDGRTGPATRAAITRFQRGHRLTADGIVGPNTEQALALASGMPPPLRSQSKVSREHYSRWSDADDRRKGRRPRDQVLLGKTFVQGMVEDKTGRSQGQAMFRLFNFKIDGAALKEEHRSYLSDLAQWMASYEVSGSAEFATPSSIWSAIIEAHASRTGLKRHNDVLSEDRYLTTRAFLETELLKRGFQVDRKLQIAGEGTGFRHSPAAEDMHARSVQIYLKHHQASNVIPTTDRTTNCKAIPRSDIRSPAHSYQVLNHRVPDGLSVGPTGLKVGSMLVRSLRERNSRVVPIEQGASRQTNLDLYELEIQVPPPSSFGSHQPMTELELFYFIRHRFDSFMDPNITSLRPEIRNEDGPIWQSDLPLGAVMVFDIPLLFGLTSRQAPVICSDYGEGKRDQVGHLYPTVFSFPTWMFSTVGTPQNPVHPVSGNRQFGLRTDGDGFVFFTRGVDRISHLQPLDDPTFEGGRQLWMGMMEKLLKSIVAHGGSGRLRGTRGEVFSHRCDWHGDIEDLLSPRFRT